MVLFFERFFSVDYGIIYHFYFFVIKGKRDIGLGDLSLNGESDGPAPPAELVDTVATAFVASVRDLDNQNFTFHELIDYYRLP